jgi:hypothetical protein
MRRTGLFAFILIISTSAGRPGGASSGRLTAGDGQARVASRPEPRFHLPPGVPILLDPSEAGPVQVAVQDLQRDLEKVLGADSPVVTSDSSVAGRPAIVVTCVGPATAKYRDATLRAWESHELRAEGTSREPRFVLEGADTRGTIYAIYEFSADYLNVPPLWYWSSWQPHGLETISFPSSLDVRFRSPDVPYRVWFPNDEDLIADWMKRSADNFNAVFETLLRLKYNTLNVDHISDYGGQPNQGLEWARECKRRGIVVAFTHYTPFGADIGDWNNYWTQVAHRQPPPLAFSSGRAPNPLLASELKEFWSHYIELAQREGFEVVETIGFRGHGDRPFWDAFSGAPATDGQRAEIINRLMRFQFALLKRTWNRQFGPLPLCRTIFYSEVSEFLAKGYLKPPAERGLVWNFSNQQRDHYPNADVMAYDSGRYRHNPVGFYMNLQFYRTGAHLAAGEGPWKQELDNRIVSEKAGRGNYIISEFNVGNVREFLMEISVGGDLLWDLDSYISGSRTIDGAVENFSTRYFGKGFAAQVAGLYRDYYNAFWQPRSPDFPGGFSRQYIFQDLRYARMAEDLLAQLATRSYKQNQFDSRPPTFYSIVPAEGATSELSALLSGTGAAVNRLDRIVSSCLSLWPQLPREDQAFFGDDMCLQAQFMLDCNLLIQGLGRAMTSLGQDDATAVVEHLEQAKDALEKARASLNQRIQGLHFAGWYARENKFGIQNLMNTLDSAISEYRGSTDQRP